MNSLYDFISFPKKERGKKEKIKLVHYVNIFGHDVIFPGLHSQLLRVLSHYRARVSILSTFLSDM